jgi:menaquinone reductase, multiheme cytochrome c subunit
MSRELFLIIILILVVGGGYLIASPSSSVVQPIDFNHKVHVDNELECSACHQRYEHSAVSGRPKLETCMLCHETALTDSAEEEKIRQYAERGEEIPWRRLFRLPDHVYYSHQTHVVSGQIECQTCHGHIGQRTSPPPRPEVKLTMDGCIACHERRGASTDCNACHK